MGTKIWVGAGLMALALVVSGDAFAFGDDLTNKQKQLQIQGQKQGQDQKQKQYQDTDVDIDIDNKDVNVNKNDNRDYNANYNKAVNEGNNNDVNVSVEGDDVDPPAIAPSVALTSSGCVGSVSLNAAIPTLGLGGGGTFTHEDCLKNEVAKTLLAMGRANEALKVLLSIDYIGASLSDPGNQAQVAPTGEIAQVEITKANRPYWCNSRRGTTMNATDRAACGIK